MLPLSEEKAIPPRRKLCRFGAVSHRRSEEAIGPLLDEPARAGKNHWHLRIGAVPG